MAVTFDTLKTARQLEAAGFTRPQAEGFADAVAVVGAEVRAALAGGVAPGGPPFDAPGLAGRLVAAGFAEAHAAAVADALSESLVLVP